MTQPVTARGWLQPELMGVLNVTPDSFSDGGQYNSLDSALQQARLLVADGATIIDVGGESTRPGASRVSLAEEQARVLPVISALAAEGIRVSIDTMNSQTALQAVAVGAQIINDVSGGFADSEMFAVAAQTEATVVIGHWRGFSDNMDSLADYSDVAADVANELSQRLAAALEAGIKPEKIVIDPGLGFAKNASQNWQLLANLERLEALGYPILIGASRKRFIAAALNESDPTSVGNAERDAATAALTALLSSRGIWGFRVHDVKTNRAALQVAEKLFAARD